MIHKGILRPIILCKAWVLKIIRGQKFLFQLHSLLQTRQVLEQFSLPSMLERASWGLIHFLLQLIVGWCHPHASLGLFERSVKGALRPGCLRTRANNGYMGLASFISAVCLNVLRRVTTRCNTKYVAR